MWLESAAFALLLPAGCMRDPSEQLGRASFACEMVQRGCGDRSSRQFVEDLEMLGADCSASVSAFHTIFGGAMPADGLDETLSIYSDVVRRPLLPEDQLEDGRALCLQEIRGMEDDLPQRLMIELRQRQYPQPYGRASQGTIEGISAIGLDDIRTQTQDFYQPQGGILSVAGRFEWGQLLRTAERLFGDWEPKEDQTVAESPPRGNYHHIQHNSTQTHIAIAFPSAAYGTGDFYQARGAVGILSDGMSSRLFTEVREKRGLCYTVSASCHSIKGQGSVICYAGTTTDRAQETLDVLVEELVRLAEGVLPEELQRLKARIKTDLIMAQESSRTRSGSIAIDWYYLNRVQTVAEVGRIIDGLTCESINAYLADHPPSDFTIVTLGANELETPVGIS